MKKSSIMKLGALALLAGGLIGLAVFRPWLGATDADDTDTRRPAVSVRVAEAAQGSVQSWVFAEGTARSVQREYLTFENAGRIEYIVPGPDGGELRAGDPVEAGVVLARQDQRRLRAEVRTAEASMREAETQLTAAEADLVEAQSDEALAQATVRRVATLLARNSATDQELEEAQARVTSAQASVARAEAHIVAAQAGVDAADSKKAQALVDLEATEITSPIDGVLAYLNIEEGFYFTPSNIRTDDETAALQSIPLVVIDPAGFEVTVDVPAYDRQRLRTGQPCLILTGGQSIEDLLNAGGLDALPGGADGPILGTVHSVNPAVSPGGRSVQVRIRTTDTSGRLEDGMFVTAWVATEVRDGVLVAPLDAFFYRDNQPFVYTVDPSTQTAALRPVGLGLRGFGVQQITQGVEQGEQLVTVGRFQLSDGANVDVLDGPAPAGPNADGADDE